jgi:hypothetical protein
MTAEKRKAKTAKWPAAAKAPRKRPPFGICGVCLCTDCDAEICGGECDWTDKTHSLCTACAAIDDDARVKKRFEALSLIDEAIEELIYDLRYELQTTDLEDALARLERVRWRIAVARDYPL